jgi:hypothetical protein
MKRIWSESGHAETAISIFRFHGVRRRVRVPFGGDPSTAGAELEAVGDLSPSLVADEFGSAFHRS